MVRMSKDEIIKMRLKRIEKEIRDTPKHKATEHHLGRLRAKLAKLKDDLMGEAQRGKGSGGARGYAIRKQGEATVVLVGPPSAGKSTLLNKLTNAKSKVAPYDFTTVKVIPGMMDYKEARIQILDVPGLIEGAEEGKGRGREVLSVVRGADLLIIMSDVGRMEAIERILKSLEKNGIRVNKKRPEVVIEKKASGGVIVHSNVKKGMTKETIKEVAGEMGVKNAEITIKVDLGVDELIDVLSKNRVYVPGIMVVNKIDLKKFSNKKLIFISAESEINLDQLREKIWEKLELVRVYLVRANEKPSKNNPMIMRKGDSLAAVMEKIGEEFSENKTRAKIWGKGAKYEGQEVSLGTKVVEGMMVRFI